MDGSGRFSVSVSASAYPCFLGWDIVRFGLLARMYGFVSVDSFPFRVLFLPVPQYSSSS